MTDHPLPWIQSNVFDHVVFDDDGGIVAECADHKIAALIVRLVNAKGKGKG